MSSTSKHSDSEKASSSISPDTEHPPLSRDVHGTKKVALADIDVAAQLVAGKDLDAVDQAEAKRVLRKIDRHILPLMCRMFYSSSLARGVMPSPIPCSSRLRAIVRR